MSGFIAVTQPGASYTTDNTIFDVTNGATLALTGSANYIILENGAGATTVTGNNDTISGVSVSGLSVTVSGASNSVAIGDGGNIENDGSGNTFTLGVNGLFVENGQNSTVYATQGNDRIVARNGDIIYGNSDVVSVWGENVTINGNNNEIADAYWGPTTLTLSGSNNTVAMSQGMALVTSTGSTTWNFDDGIVLTGSETPSDSTLTGGLLTIQMGNGNIATFSSVASGSQIEYVDASGNDSWTTVTDTNLVNLGGRVYEVLGSGAGVNMSNSIFDVVGGSMSLTGSSNQLIAETTGSIAITGNGNTLIGGSVEREQVNLWNSTGSTVTVGSGSFVDEHNGNGNTITVGANGTVLADGAATTTIYATGGGDRICTGSGDTVYANSDSVELWRGSATVTGNNNQITDASSSTKTLSLSGSGNAVALGTGMTVATSTGTLTDDNGLLVFGGSITSSDVTLVNGVLSVQLGNGNVASLNGVTSSTQIEYVDASGNATFTTMYDTSVQQLIGAMACTSTNNGGGSLVSTAGAENDSLFHGQIVANQRN
jgi:trimeric autotransporter adhesin